MTLHTFRAIPASSEVYGLAEGPVWDAGRERVLWVDINAGAVHSGILRDDRVEARERFTIDVTAGAVACAVTGELLVAGTRGLHTVATDGKVTAGVQLIPDAKVSRLNDGKCDPAGRFLVGSMALDDRTGEEVLLSIGHTGSITVLDGDLTLSNGLGWSPDATVLYSTDTIPGVIWSRAYDVDASVSRSQADRDWITASPRPSDSTTSARSSPAPAPAAPARRSTSTRGRKGAALLPCSWVGFVFGWGSALPTSLALLVRATLRYRSLRWL